MDQSEVRDALAAADAAYEPFAPFDAWEGEPLGTGSWDDAADHLATVRASATVDEVGSALDEVLRAAAVDTGAIEGLYRADRGFTLSVARNVISLDQAEVEAGLGFRRSFEAQLAGFELAVQLATGEEVITEAAIREVHRVTCADDSTYRVLTEIGVQERELVLGSYKTEPNHVELGNGTWHSYAPVDRVPDEMHRLVEAMQSEAFASAPAVVQAAFAHHAFTSVHPFPDGNGRVARLLASIFLLRAASIPLWVEVSDREAYLDALSSADHGDRQPFLAFIRGVTLHLLRELALALAVPSRPAPPDDDAIAAIGLASVLARELGHEVGIGTATMVIHPAAHRPAEGIDVPEGATITVGGAGLRAHHLAVGVDRGATDDDRFVVVVDDGDAEVRRFEFSLNEARPLVTPSAERRLTMVARVVLGLARQR